MAFRAYIVRLVVVLATTGAFVATALVAIGYSGFRLAQDAATASELRLPDLVTGAAVPSVIYAANGTVMATLRSSLNRQPVSLDQIRPILVHAVLDTEDHSFWDHGGLDVESMVRAALADVNAGSAVQGGSTIAQQLVKTTYLTDQKTLEPQNTRSRPGRAPRGKVHQVPDSRRLLELGVLGQRRLRR